MTFEEAIIKEFHDRFADMPTSAHWYKFVEQFIRDALAKYKSELLEEVDREVIGVDMETDPDKLGHDRANQYMDIYEAINLEKAEQRQKLAELKGKNE